MRRRRFPRISIRYVLPNLVTLLALCLGLTSIRFAFEERYEMAVYAIIAAAVLDGLDGRIARALKGTSRFGAELDSLADFMSFGAAPAVLLYSWGLHEARHFGWFAVLVYAVACALRLARFNVALDEPGQTGWRSQFFTGMPSPAGAVTVMLPIYLNLSIVELPNARWMAPFIIVYVLIISLLMVSPIPHFSGKHLGRVPRDKFIVVLFAGVFGLLLLATSPMEVMAVASIAFLCSIPFSVRSFQARLAAERAVGQDGVDPPPASPSVDGGETTVHKSGDLK